MALELSSVSLAILMFAGCTLLSARMIEVAMPRTIVSKFFWMKPNDVTSYSVSVAAGEE